MSEINMLYRDHSVYKSDLSNTYCALKTIGNYCQWKKKLRYSTIVTVCLKPAQIQSQRFYVLKLLLKIHNSRSTLTLLSED